MFKEDAWRSLEPLEKGLVLGVLAGTVLALLTWQISWIAVGVSLGTGIGHITGRRLRMQRKTGHHAQDEDSVPFPVETIEHRAERLREGVDEELSAAMRGLREAWHDYKYDPARHSGEPVPSGDERFITEFGPEGGYELLAAIRTLHAEAGSIPDPCGPLLGGYYDALKAWADTHPEVDRAELNLIIDRLLWEHR